MRDDDTTDETDPFDELDDPEGDPFAELDDPATVDEAFVEMSVDEDAVFEELVDEEREATAERHTAVIPKRTYCERCEYFSSPPEVGCTNPGTEIVELVDTEHFRVVDCPVVERRREVEGLDLDLEESTSDR